MQGAHRDQDSLLPFARPDVGEEAADAVREVILSGWLTTGDRCRQLEEEFAAAVEGRHAVALSSCTAALHLSLEALGVGPGDIVVTSPYTFASTAEVIRYFDAVPVFVDIDPATFNLDVNLLEATVDGLSAGDRSFLPPSLRDRAQARSPAAVIPVHIGGVPCDLDRVYKIAAVHGMAVVEDAAHAFPAAYGACSIGAPINSDVPSTRCFSFYATKTITTGEGGMLVTDDARVADRARLMSLHGMSRNAWNREGGDTAWSYAIVAPGYKYNMTDLAATLGLDQLDRVDGMRDRRAVIAGRYTDAFERLDTLEVPTVPINVESAWHLYMLRIRPGASGIDRDGLATRLQERGIGTSVHFIPLHLHAYYRERYGYRDRDFPISVREFERELSLPIYSGMTDDEVERVIEAVRAIVSESAR